MDEVKFTINGTAGIITLNKPKSLNSLNLEMGIAIKRQLIDWQQDNNITKVIIKSSNNKAFCAGGDIKSLYYWGIDKSPNFTKFYQEEYSLNKIIKNYSKPYIALVDGINMGGGMGISVNGSHIVASENASFAMPETTIGFFPDVGASYFLNKCPGKIGLYLGLTGNIINTYDAINAEFVTHYVFSRNFQELEQALCNTEETDNIIEHFCNNELGNERTQHRLDLEKINFYFSQESLIEIINMLKKSNDEWAKVTLENLNKKSPISLAVTFRQLQLAKNMNFDEAIDLEYKITVNMFNSHDFFEGVKSLLITKDKSPKWFHSNIEQITDQELNRYFSL